METLPDSKVGSGMNGIMGGRVQAREGSSSSLYIRRNLSLYQQLTKEHVKNLELPSSPVEKKSLQERWAKFPSPFPMTCYNTRNGTWQSDSESSAEGMQRTFSSKRRRKRRIAGNIHVHGTPKMSRRTAHGEVTEEEYPHPWRTWLSLRQGIQFPENQLKHDSFDYQNHSSSYASTSSASESWSDEDSFKQTSRGEQNFRDKRFQVVDKVRPGEKHRAAVTTAHGILKEENSRLQSKMLDLKRNHEKILIGTERMEILVKFCSSIEPCINTLDPSVIKMAWETMEFLFPEPNEGFGVYNRRKTGKLYSTESQSFSTTCKNESSANVIISTQSVGINTDERGIDIDFHRGKWGRRVSEISNTSQETERLGSSEDTMFSIIAENSMDSECAVAGEKETPSLELKFLLSKALIKSPVKAAFMKP